MDAVGAPITEAVAALTAEFPDGEVLLNLSSGTPQMKIALAFLAADLRRSMRGIQVKNFERASGTTERTNAPDYSVADELECNEDEAPDAPNRCSEPELMHMQRQRAKEQLLTLLDVRDYSAIYTMKNLPNQLKALIGHLDARDKMQSEAARNYAQNLKLPFSLYPVRTGAPRSDYAEVSEAYLVLLNRSHRQQYEEMILRLNPLVVRLELQLMKTVLAGKNLRLGEKLTHMGQRTTRAKLMSYFSAEAQRRGGYEFDIPFSRQQLADYLGVERSGLSLELGKMRDEGLLDFHKSHFLLKAPETDGLPPSAR